MQPKVSVIVPIYNSEEFLEDCLRSIANQTLQEIQVIMVDDGSTDRSGDICKKFNKAYGNFEYFYKDNGGPASARNFGITKALGEYIGFVDSDDWIAPEMYEVLYENARRFQSDVVACRFFEDANPPYIVLRFGAYDREQIINEIYPFLLPTITEKGTFRSIRWSNCNKLYRNAIIDNNRIQAYEGSFRAEDLTFDFQVNINANNYYYLDKQLYHNRRRPVSNSRGYQNNLWNAYKGVVDFLTSRAALYSCYDFRKQLGETTFFFAVLAIENEVISKKRLFAKNRSIRDIMEDSVCIASCKDIDQFTLNKKYRALYDMIDRKLPLRIIIYYRIRRLKMWLLGSGRKEK